MRQLTERKEGKVIFSPLAWNRFTKSERFYVLMMNKREDKCGAPCKTCECNRELWNCMILEAWHQNFLGIVSFCMTPAVWNEEDEDGNNSEVGQSEIIS